MKPLFILAFFFFTTIAIGQNLIPNGDFESYYGCPTALTQIDSSYFWMSPDPNGTPDYFNQCATTNIVDVPLNIWGWQNAHGGSGYAGISLWLSTLAYGREYLETPISTPLVNGVTYHFEMYVNSIDACKYTVGNIGIYFSDTLLQNVTSWYFPQLCYPQITYNGPVFDSINWTQVSGDYTAHGGESYLLMANFNPDSTTTTAINNPNANWMMNFAYVYIDDVSLMDVTAISENAASESMFTISPVPANEEITISSKVLMNDAEISVIDICGRVVATYSMNGVDRLSINVSRFDAGQYFVICNGSNFQYPFVISH